MKLLLLAIRTLLRFRLYTIINIVGLALSLGSCILISRYVHEQWMTDRFIPELDRVYLCTMEDEMTHRKSLNGISPAFGGDIFDILQEPAIERYAVYFNLEKDQITVNNKLCVASTLATDTNWLKIIPIPIIQTTTKQLLEHPEDAAITALYAQKIFGEEDPIGKEIYLSCGKTVIVKAILGTTATRFSMPFDLIISRQIADFDRLIMPKTLFLLHKGTQLAEANDNHLKFKQLFQGKNRTRAQFYPLNKLYFDLHLAGTNDSWPKGNYTHLLILSTIALLILVIGLFNFINIYTAIGMKRSREFGMKKVFGASRKQMAIQLYLENCFMTLLALLLAWTFVEIGGTAASSLMGISVPSDFYFNLEISVAFLLLLPVLTSIYPFIRYNYIAPVYSIRSVDKSSNPALSRSIFLCLQYILTIVLIILSMLSIRQLHFMLHAEPGFQTADIIMTPSISAPITGNMEQWNIYNNTNGKIENAVKTSPLFENLVFSTGPLYISDYNSVVWLPGQEKKEVKSMSSTENYFKMLGIQLKEGRLWNDSIDSYRDFNVIINETAQKMLGIKDISQATLLSDEFFVYYTNMEKGRKPEYKIIGVVKDFTSGHLSKNTPPIVFTHYTCGIQVGMMAKIVSGKKQEAILFLQQLYNEISGNEFRYSFLEDEIRTLYDTDKLLVQIASFFAIIAILISSMGLFSLSLFDVQQRFREISIRKVNGASTQSIIWMLLGKYYKLLGVAFLIAAPTAWLIMTFYLDDFAHKAPMAWWIFMVALSITAGISFLTLIYQTRKAAGTNPADIIRSE